MDLGLRSFGRRTRANKNKVRGDASARRAAEKICAAGRDRCGFDYASANGCNHAVGRASESVRDPNCSSLHSGGVRFATNASIAHRRANHEPVAIASSVSDSSASYRGQSDAGGYAHATGSALAVDSGSSQPDCRTSNNANDSASNGAAGREHPGADHRSINPNGTCCETRADNHSNETPADAAARSAVANRRT